MKRYAKLHASTKENFVCQSFFKVNGISVIYFHEKQMLKRLCIKPGIQERGTECGERGEWGNVIFRGMSPNIPGNVFNYSGEHRQTFRGIQPNIPGNVAKPSEECSQTFWRMQPNIPGNAVKHFWKCPIYFDRTELVEASSMTVLFPGELLIVCSVIFCVENLAKLLAARLNSGGNLISMP